MSAITVTAMEPGWFGVQVDEGHRVTSHRVHVPEDRFAANLPEGVDAELLVTESIAYLLEKEPATAIMDEFSLGEIVRYYADYPDDIRGRVST